jgi:hypothetical protein
MAQYHKFQLFNYGLLREADDEDKTKTTTRDKTKTPGFSIPDPEIGRAAPTASKPSDEPAAQRTASAKTTQDKTRNLSIGPEGMRHMLDLTRNLDQIDTSQELDLDQDTEVGIPEPEPPTADNLPAVLQRGLMRGDEVQPEWHQVKNLPGYMSKPIRALGRQLFSMFTRTPIDTINVLADLSGQGPNEHQELNAVSARLRDRGRRLRQAEVSMRDLMPDYDAQISMFEADGYTFMLVKDFAGRYIYSWPSKDTIKGGSSAAAPDEAPALAPPPRRLR